MTGQTMQRLCELLDQLSSAHTVAAICTDEIRTLICSEAGQRTSVRPRVDDETLCVCWRDKACHLGETYPLRLFERLCRRPNHYVALEQLLEDVWEGNVRAPETVRSVVRHLRRRLRDADMGELAAAIRCRGCRYGLILNPDA